MVPRGKPESSSQTALSMVKLPLFLGTSVDVAEKFGKDRACGSLDILADRQTHRQTDIHTDVFITILRHCNCNFSCNFIRCELYFARYTAIEWASVALFIVDVCYRISGDWTFDESMAAYGCTVHSFDPRYSYLVVIVVARRSRHSQECKNPRRHCFCDS